MIIFLFGFSVWRRLFLSSPISHSITYYLNSEIAVKCPFVLGNIQCNVQEIRVDVIYMDLFHACIIYSQFLTYQFSFKVQFKLLLSHLGIFQLIGNGSLFLVHFHILMSLPVSSCEKVFLRLCFWVCGSLFPQIRLHKLKKLFKKSENKNFDAFITINLSEFH